ncbi:hypothetical protein HRbin39_01938 [bacterium HR39]|nr:hypothetical protein HRbin39_01938 [bacterium HR39]
MRRSEASGVRTSLRRIGAMFRRHWYLLTSSWPRVLELVYWPTVQITLWGFITLWLARAGGSAMAHATALFLSAVLLWDTFFRSQLGVALSFLEELWARNLGHLFVSPLRPFELVLSLFAMSLVRTLIGVGGAALLAVPIHGFSIAAALGPALVLFFSGNLIFGWALGLASSALVLRLGLGAESLVWALVFLLQPVCAVFYPLSVLPEPLRWIGLALPPAHVFEGMRALVLEGRFAADHLLAAFALDLFWLLVAGGVFALLLESARRRGLLLQVAE